MTDLLGGGGGGYDTSGLEDATKQSLALQEQIYNQAYSDNQPWYNMGAGSVSKLSDLLGVSGGSMQSQDQIYNNLLPQYTTTQTQNGTFTDPTTGQVITVGDQDQYLQNFFSNVGDKDIEKYREANVYFDAGDTDTAWDKLGYDPLTTSTSSVDYDALNSAVAQQYEGQETPGDYGSLLERFDLTKFEEDPSYQYIQDQSNKALERSMAAQGVTLGGAGYGDINPQVASALAEQNQNLASTEYNNAYNRYNTDQSNVFNMLMGTAGMGQGATSIMANAGTNYANASTDLNTSLASAQQQAAIAQASEPSMFGSLLGAGAQVAGAYFSDRRLKENVVYVGRENGHKIYESDYLDGSGRYRGVMAQDILISNPSAVKIMPNGYYAVNYSALGVNRERV